MYIENMTNAELGAKIRLNHERHLERVELMTPQWKKEGDISKKLRTSLKITIKEISDLTGACPKVISKYEHGQYIIARNVVSRSYHTAINYIISNRQKHCVEGNKHE